MFAILRLPDPRIVVEKSILTSRGTKLCLEIHVDMAEKQDVYRSCLVESDE